MFTNYTKVHGFINELLIANYRAQEGGEEMRGDSELQDEIATRFPRAKLKPIHVYRSYFNRRIEGFGWAEANKTLCSPDEMTHAAMDLAVF